MSTDILPVAGPVNHLTPPSGGRWLIADYEHLPDGRTRLVSPSPPGQRTVSVIASGDWP